LLKGAREQEDGGELRSGFSGDLQGRLRFQGGDTIRSLISTMTTNNDQEEKSRRRWPNQGTDREKGSEKRKNEPETCRRRDLLGRRRPWR
jgi:hypothetical protein